MRAVHVAHEVALVVGVGVVRVWRASPPDVGARACADVDADDDASPCALLTPHPLQPGNDCPTPDAVDQHQDSTGIMIRQRKDWD